MGSGHQHLAGTHRVRELAPGAIVPSIVAIHQEFGVAKTTARKVLAQLREEGLIVTTPGWGSFVREAD